MKKYRCKNCGMACEVSDHALFFDCKMCESKTRVSEAEKVVSIDYLYDSTEYHRDSEQHAQEHVFENKDFSTKIEEELDNTKNSVFNLKEKMMKPSIQLDYFLLVDLFKWLVKI